MKDRRIRYQCINRFILLIFALTWVTVIAVADDKPSYSEHAVDIMSFQFKVIATLLGLIQVLIGFIYISGIHSVKVSIRELFKTIAHMQETKLSKEDHDRICDKP